MRRAEDSHRYKTEQCVELRTVTDIRQSSAFDTFIAESVYLELNSLCNWEPVERLKQKSNMVSFTSFQDDESTTILNAFKEAVIGLQSCQGQT